MNRREFLEAAAVIAAGTICKREISRAESAGPAVLGEAVLTNWERHYVLK